PLSIERLEDRTVPSTLTVGNLADSGPGSLRAVIVDANANPGADLIHFAPSARDGTITLTSGELTITDDLRIDGPGAGRLAVGGAAGAGAPFTRSGIGGAVMNDAGTLTISDSAFHDNRAIGGFGGGFPGGFGAGGAIANVALFGDANLSVSHSTLTDNQAVG